MASIFGLTILHILVNLISNYSFTIVGDRLTIKLSEKLDSYMKEYKKEKEKEKNKSSEIKLDKCKALTSDNLSIILQAIGGLGFSIIYSFVTNWKLTLCMLGFVIIYFFTYILSDKFSICKKKKKSTKRCCAFCCCCFCTRKKVKKNNSEPETPESSNESTLEIQESDKKEQEIVKNSDSPKNSKSALNSIEKNEKIRRRKSKKSYINREHVSIFVRSVSYSVSTSIVFFEQAAALNFGFYLTKKENLGASNIFRVYGCLNISSEILQRSYTQKPDQKEAEKEAIKLESMTQIAIKFDKPDFPPPPPPEETQPSQPVVPKKIEEKIIEEKPLPEEPKQPSFEPPVSKPPTPVVPEKSSTPTISEPKPPEPGLEPEPELKSPSIHNLTAKSISISDSSETDQSEKIKRPPPDDLDNLIGEPLPVVIGFNNMYGFKRNTPNLRNKASVFASDPGANFETLKKKHGKFMDQEELLEYYKHLHVHGYPYFDNDYINIHPGEFLRNFLIFNNLKI